MKVLYYIAYPQRMAGANRSLLALITNLPTSVQPIVICSGQGQAVKVFCEAGVDTRVIVPGTALNSYGKAMLSWSRSRQLWIGLKELLPYTWQLFCLIKYMQIDLVHVNDARACLLVGLAARLAGVPLVGHLRGENAIGGIAWTFFEKATDHIIAVSQAVQASLSPQAQHKATTIYNGINVSEVTRSGNSIRWLEHLKAQGFLIVACFASIVPFKGYHHLVATVAELNKRGWNNKVAFCFVGDLVPEYQDYQEWLFGRQHALGIVNLIWTGWQPNPFSFYCLADIVVLPSVAHEYLQFGDQRVEVKGNEGFPRTLLEAMCFRLPIVATDIAGVCEQVEDGVNGFLVPPADSGALADALEKLLADPGLRKRMGLAGLEKVRRSFSIETAVARVLHLYNVLLPDLHVLKVGYKHHVVS